MAVVFYPKNSIIVRRDTISSSFEELVLSTHPNVVLYFNTASAIEPISLSMFVDITCSYALTASFAKSAISSSWASSSFSSFSSISSSWASSSLSSSISNNAITSSFSVTSSFALGIPSIKSGIISGALFLGTPRTSSVVFTSSYPNNLYAISVVSEASRTWTIQSKTSAGFTINSNSSTAFTGLVFWKTTAVGEFYR